MNENQRPLKFKLRFETDEGEELSRVRPAYVNNFTIQRFESDIFLDMCIVPVDALASVQQQAGEDEQEIEMVILDRYVLSVSSLLRLRDSINEMCRQLSEQGLIPQNASTGSQTKTR